MRLLSNIIHKALPPATANRLIRGYIHHRNLYTKGQAELGILRNLVSYQALLITYLSADNLMTKLGLDLPLWMVFAGLAVAVVLKIIMQWSLGWWWDRNRIFDKEADWSNTRNPLQKEISKSLLNGTGIEK